MHIGVPRHEIWGSRKQERTKSSGDVSVVPLLPSGILFSPGFERVGLTRELPYLCWIGVDSLHPVNEVRNVFHIWSAAESVFKCVYFF